MSYKIHIVVCMCVAGGVGQRSFEGRHNKATDCEYGISRRVSSCEHCAPENT